MLNQQRPSYKPYKVPTARHHVAVTVGVGYCWLWTDHSAHETTEGEELSHSRRAATAEVLLRTTSTEIITLASNISADQLRTGNFGFQDTVYFAT